MNNGPQRLLSVHAGLGLIALLAVSGAIGSWTHAAATRLSVEDDTETAAAGVAVAGAANENYCSTALKQILRRVLTSCGLVKADQGRGCQPLEAKTVAAMSGGDFNALFRPLSQRAAIVQFDKDSAALDDAGRALLENAFSDQRGASYFLVVSRASPEGSVEHNRQLSEARARGLLDYLETKFKDPDLEREVGLLWLGEEFAPLDEEFCQWKRSRGDAVCTTAELNRSAFVAWIDCTL